MDLKNKDKFKQVHIKVFIIPVIVITLIFFVISYFIIKNIKVYYYNHIKEDSLNFSKSYSHSLYKAAQAKDIVNELLDEKLLVATRTAASYDRRYSNELLKELSRTLEVDEIDYYNSQGELIYSNMAQLIGWKTYKGHPVYNFMHSDSVSTIDKIRQDSITGNYYKYAYFKVSNGGIVQIGVKADKVYKFLGAFEVQQLLDEMHDVEVIDKIFFIDNKLNVVSSTDSQSIGQKITNQEVKAAILESRGYSFINNHDKEYQILMPIYFEENKIGTLAITQSLRDTEKVIRQVSIVGLGILIVIYVFLIHIMISTYNKNRRFIQLAYCDRLTGLPNKQYFKEFLTEEIKKKEENNKAFLLINCRNFTILNLTYGYEYGDEVLKELSRRIQKLVDSNEKLFRFSADRFVLYVKNYDGKKELVSITNIISRMFNKPFKVKDAEQNLDVQIGIVEINSKYDNVDKILKHASIALSYIKNNDSIKYAFFNEVMESKLQREDLIEKELRAGIAKNDMEKLYLEFQPQVHLKMNKVICFEALARMKTESLGFISPLEFIDVAERKQLIVPLGNLILKKACDFIRTLKSEGYDDIKVAVNISGIQLLRDDFIGTVMDIIKETQIEESNLELEITESVILGNYEIINEKFKILKERKIGIALDDFGTGYSSFSRLKELNIDTVKIDKYFISKISIGECKELITGDIISMAHKLGLKVVTEGVEVEEQKDYLIENSCDIMQGYLFSKPLPEEGAIELLKRSNNVENKLIE